MGEGIPKEFGLAFLGIFILVVLFLIVRFFTVEMKVYKNFFEKLLKRGKGNKKNKNEKNVMINALLKDIKEEDMTFTFNSYQGISREACSNIFPVRPNTKFSSEDQIYGTIRSSRYKTSDVCCWSYDASNKDSTDKEIDFRGRYFVMENDKTINTTVTIMRELDYLSNSKNSSIKFGEKVDMENDEFNMLFNVYCPDSIEALKVIKPHTMERLIDFSKKFNNAHMIIKLFANRIHIFINDFKDNFCFYDIEKDLERLTNETNLQIECIKDFYRVFIF